MDRKAYLFRKQRRKELMPMYLAELNAILDAVKGGYVVKETDETDIIMQAGHDNIPTEPEKKVQVRFGLKDRFLTNVFTQCNARLSGKVYLWTDYSSDCGIAEIDSIMMINPAFEFKAEHAGLIIIFSENLRNKLLLDFYEGGGENFIEAAFFGNDWGGIEIIH